MSHSGRAPFPIHVLTKVYRHQTPNQACSPVHVGGLSPRLVNSAFKRTKWHFGFEEMESEDADCQLLDMAVSL